MLKRSLFILLLGVSFIGNAKISLHDAFISMPDTLCPFLEIQQRSFLANVSSLSDTIPNRLNGETAVIERTEQMLRVFITEGVEYDLLLQNDTIIFIQTVCAPICSSVVKQYDSNWNYLNTVVPTIQGTFVEAKWQNGTIVYQDNTPELLDEEEKKEYKRNSSTL